MAKTSLKPLKAILETIPEQEDFALKQLQKSEEQHSMRAVKCPEYGDDIGATLTHSVIKTDLVFHRSRKAASQPQVQESEPMVTFRFLKHLCRTERRTKVGGEEQSPLKCCH